MFFTLLQTLGFVSIFKIYIQVYTCWCTPWPHLDIYKSPGQPLMYMTKTHLLTYFTKIRTLHKIQSVYIRTYDIHFMIYVYTVT